LFICLSQKVAKRNHPRNKYFLSDLLNFLMYKSLIKINLSILFFFILQFQYAQKIALLKYSGGGDWYANITTSLPNLVNFSNKQIHTVIDKKIKVVEPSSVEIFDFPFIHATGHGNIFFSETDIQNLRKYLKNGGFIHFDDNYGMDKYVRREIKKLFPRQELKELPVFHPIFHAYYNFQKGLPKIHEHDGKPPQAFGIFINNRLVLLYTYESDLGDGWESEEIHHDPAEIREKALKMGANILYYVFTN